MLRALVVGVVVAIINIGNAEADTITTFSVSGTDLNEISITNLGEDGCTQETCNNYAPGTFAGTITIDLTTGTMTAANINAGIPPYGGDFVTPANYTGGGFCPFGNCVFNVPAMFIDVDLLDGAVTGHVTGSAGNSGASGVAADFVTDMEGILAFTPSPTPLPAALSLFAGGLGIVGFLSRRRKRNTAPA
jgi:hypothetical protein